MGTRAFTMGREGATWTLAVEAADVVTTLMALSFPALALETERDRRDTPLLRRGNAGRGDRFELPEVVEIVTRHGFDQHFERHLSALGMKERF